MASIWRKPETGALFALGIILTGCSAHAAVDPGPILGAGPAQSRATWQLAAPNEITPETREFTILVTRMSCASGHTGAVEKPVVQLKRDAIYIRVDAKPLGDGAYSCPGNDTTPLRVTLPEAVGERKLVDVACRYEPEVFREECLAPNPVRWP